MGELDDLLRQAATAATPATRRLTLTITNPSEREVRRLRLMAQTVNSHKAPGLFRAKITEETSDHDHP